MKKILLLFTAIACCISIATAQTDSARIASLETEVKAMQSTLSELKSEVAEVTRQNLSLKQALQLQPTISEATSPGGINYRLIEATGNRQDGTIKLVLSVLNTGVRDQEVQHNPSYKVIDEKGYAYDCFREVEKSAIANEAIDYIVRLYPNTPVEMQFIFKPNSQSEYIKLFDLQDYKKVGGFRFANIPIKWK